MSKVLSTVALITLTLSPIVAMAESDATGFTVSPGVALNLFDGNRNFQESVNGSLGIGYRFDSPWAVELNYRDLGSEIKNSGASANAHNYSLDALYHLEPQSDLTPYVMFGAGQSSYDTATGKSDETSFGAGLGLKYLFSAQSAIRTGVRINRALENNSVDAGLFLNYQYTFGQASLAPVSKPAPMKPAPKTKRDGDDDADGVPDSIDQCLTTPRGETVDARGCSNDTDKDGVTNAADQCPTTPAERKVDVRGCQFDDDRDGVVNHTDQCPNTVPPALVDEQGCYLVLDRKVSITLDVMFDFDSAASRTEHAPEVKKVADFMAQYPLTRVTLEGYTDDRGAEGYNRKLSERRAYTILRILVDQFGIPSDRVSAVGYGESSPVASNDTDAGRQKNRRVVAQIEAITQVKERL